MGLFDFFKKKKMVEVELTEEELKHNKMWDMWVEGTAESPYAELMTYQSEVNNGGHDQYFLNVGNTGDLKKDIEVLQSILSPQLKKNLIVAYEAYSDYEAKGCFENSDDEADEKLQEVLDQCDDVFYENEEEINTVLEEYALKIEL